MHLEVNESGFVLSHKNRQILQHTAEQPCLYLGKGVGKFDMYRGNFDITDYVTERVALKTFIASTIEEDGQKYHSVTFLNDGQPVLSTIISLDHDNRLKVAFEAIDSSFNRFWLRIQADEQEKVFGCGEQLSYLNLRGKNFPLWSSEPGVGRNKNSYVTWQADVKDKAGGDYYTTNYPQPTFISDKKYFCHLQTTAYADFDFTHSDFHELQCWEIPQYLLIDAEESFIDLSSNISNLFGRQPELPEWVYNGVILGIQGGTNTTIQRLTEARNLGVKVAGAWCQDWQGIKMTSFGKRLRWNWQWDKQLYPELDKTIHQLKEDGIRFLGYINPYLLDGQPLYKEALSKGYLATNKDGSDYLVDFGEFYCGVIDFTNTEACEWYKGVIKNNLIDFGLDGWMGDFGEYLPTDCQLSNDVSAEIEHNHWPHRWAKVQHEAIDESGKLDDILFFMRAGGIGSQKYCHTLWAGDQSVDWSLDDGLASVIPAALSSGLVGNGIHHSDIGGYTTLHGMKRSKELFQRWAEMAAFTPIMRTHEGNRPEDNHQFYSDEDTLAHLAKMTQIYTHLKPYIRDAVKLNTARGIPVQRPLFMHYEDDQEAYEIKYQYLFGEDILVAPTYNQGETIKSVYLPNDEWIHAWTGDVYQGGWLNIDAPIGKPAVFYKASSNYKDLLDKLINI